VQQDSAARAKNQAECFSRKGNFSVECAKGDALKSVKAKDGQSGFRLENNLQDFIQRIGKLEQENFCLLQQMKQLEQEKVAMQEVLPVFL